MGVPNTPVSVSNTPVGVSDTGLGVSNTGLGRSDYRVPGEGDQCRGLLVLGSLLLAEARCDAARPDPRQPSLHPRIRNLMVGVG